MSEDIKNSEARGEDAALHVDGMFKNWFLDYASYVILERAVPAIEMCIRDRWQYRYWPGYCSGSKRL